jgi:DNA-binding CsgD family transcriptional regulator
MGCDASAPRATGGLTRREQEILALLAAGLSNQEIALRFYISRIT